MGNLEENNQIADVICQHRRDGTIVPMKVRIRDDDGEFQTYMIKGYKDLTQYRDYVMPNQMSATSHIWQFECKIIVFGKERCIRLLYNAFDNRWKVLA